MDKENKKIIQEIIEKLKDKSDEEVEEEFMDLICNQLTDEQFWNFVISWKSVEDVVDEMEEWDIETKREEIANIKANFMK